MPYIKTERVAEIRKQLKAKFPEFKFSVRRRNYSTVIVDILQGPINFNATGHGVNTFYIKDHFSGEAANVLLEIKEIMNAGNGTLTVDGDYGVVPNFYIDINIGTWDKSYKWVVKENNCIIKLKHLKKSA